MVLSEIIAATIGVIGTILVSLISYVAAKRAGIGPFQDTLVSKLKDVVNIQGIEIDSLKTTKTSQDEKIKTLERKVTELEGTVEELKDLTVKQALLIEKLTVTRRRTTKTVVTD